MEERTQSDTVNARRWPIWPADGGDWGLIGRLALGLAIGGAGGVLAYWLHVPLAFMLGSLFACMAATVAGVPAQIPMRFRSVFLVLIGLFLGEGFDADAAARLATWPISILLAMLYVPVAVAASYVFYTRVARFDRMTGLLASVPGGLSAVVLFAGALEADERKVALTQSLRVALVVTIAPALAFGVFGYDAPDMTVATAQSVSLGEAALLGVSAALGTLLFHKLGVPLPFLVAPIFASAALRLAGVVEGVLPIWLVDIALVVVGASIGCRFRGERASMLAAIAGWTLLGTLVLMAVAAVFGAGVAIALDVDLTVALLSFAPGGVAEMALIAIALDADPAFVATHHLARIMFILVATPFVAAWAQRAWVQKA